MKLRDLANHRFLGRLGLVAAGLGVLAALVVLSGVVPVRASSGHWPATRWLFQFGKQRSVSTHTLGMRAPALDDPALVLKGARHYASGCEPCHGAPGERRSSIARESTPEPPWLVERVARWDDPELFYIVKHGIKFTGMPAWPSLEREDEVWAVVAFLRILPRLDATSYRRLAMGDDPEADEAGLAGLGGPSLPSVEGCARCHDGPGDGAFPSLTGQNAEYLEGALEAYAEGRRHSGIMQPVAAALDRTTLRGLARHYGGGRWVGEAAAAPAGSPASPAEVRASGDGPLPGDSDAEASVAPPRVPGMAAPLPRLRATPAALALGEAIARQGVPERKVPSCVDCHGPGDLARNPNFPLLAGQHPAYLALQLRLFKEERRGGSPFHHIMGEVTRNMTPEQMEAVALWYGSLGAPSSPPG